MSKNEYNKKTDNETEQENINSILSALKDAVEQDCKTVKVYFTAKDGSKEYLHYDPQILSDIIKEENDTELMYDGFSTIPEESLLFIDRTKSAIGHVPTTSDIVKITYGRKVLFSKYNKNNVKMNTEPQNEQNSKKEHLNEEK